MTTTDSESHSANIAPAAFSDAKTFIISDSDEYVHRLKAVIINPDPESQVLAVDISITLPVTSEKKGWLQKLFAGPPQIPEAPILSIGLIPKHHIQDEEAFARTLEGQDFAVKCWSSHMPHSQCLQFLQAESGGRDINSTHIIYDKPFDENSLNDFLHQLKKSGILSRSENELIPNAIWDLVTNGPAPERTKPQHTQKIADARRNRPNIPVK